MSKINPSLVGSVFERNSSTSFTPPVPSGSGKTGFPAVQHRSKSAFARNRDELRKPGYTRSQDAPPKILSDLKPEPVDPDQWRWQMSRENEQRVEGMTEEEREEERRAIMDRFGAGVGDLLKRVKNARMKQAQGTPNGENTQDVADSLKEVPITSADNFITHVPSKDRLSPPPILSTSSTRPSSRADRQLRFAELAPQDVHVYESAPPSPRRKPLALPPPTGDGSSISLGQWKSTMKSHKTSSGSIDVEPEEGTPEYIRRRYFPEAPVNDPNVAWMEVSASSEPDLGPSALRFDLTGKPIPYALSSSLPSHLGLHHHADGEHAGYTLDDIFLLSRSSVPAQRATMLGVLARIAQRVSNMQEGDADELDEFFGKEEELRKRIIGAGLEAMSGRGSVGARAIEVVWQCIVGWDQDVISIENVELEVPGDAAISSLPLEFLLPLISTTLVQGAASGETSVQLLEILHRLAQQSNSIAEFIVATPQLISSVIQTFLLTPIPPTNSSPAPVPSAIEFLIVLAKSSRSNAKTLTEPADALLRFITLLPPSSPYPIPLTTSLLTSTLRFYTVLASYGLYSHVASTAMSHFAELNLYIISNVSRSQKLTVAWLDLLAAWIVCAVDPHQTTPSHDILWSQIVSWGWNGDVGELERRLDTNEIDWDVWAGTWQVRAAWLEGARVNGMRGGSEERLECIQEISTGFEDGKAKTIIFGVLDAITQELSQSCSASIYVKDVSRVKALARLCGILTQAIRLWLACLPPLLDDPLASPPFPLPFPRISELCAKLVTHPVWGLVKFTEATPPHLYVFCRPLSMLLSSYLRLSYRLPGISEDLWMAQALSILSKLLPGEEESAQKILDDLTGLITIGWTTPRHLRVPQIVWDRGGMTIIKPFIMYVVRPQADVYLGPPYLTPQSIMLSTTQRLPPATVMRKFGLPLRSDWTFSPLEDLLRSGSSRVFKALPLTWDASEVEIVRVALLLTKISRELLQRYSLRDFTLTREEAVFGCMKVFMLEHGQPQNESTEEVFHDPIVQQFMNDILHPYTIGGVGARLPATPVIPPATRGNLEAVSAQFLGKTPFYQYYTDFVALYDAISFSNPLFARLLLVPTSMRYALDYRKHLWNDFQHVLKTIRIPVDQVVSEDIREYLWPVEVDSAMIGLYLRSLIKDSLDGFIQMVALHHIASSIWPDLNGNNDWDEVRASKLLSAVVGQGSIDLVREVVQYHQYGQESMPLLPPHCFKGIGHETKVTRMESIDRWGLPINLRGLFDEIGV
ncbi:hypothetical protein BDZ94DRAFT_1308216 [Collybia nuda]|uniref:RNA polymerase II-associated protein 1 C-terminal domain-containing protein n=1 Tax=Collybia nuda TaxID=64659 RepID=A0A9P5Y9C4_9AGAR|nr:hypothetical protein BDZ94DRAFT_1308216 [Collybia nuda]